MRLFLDFRSRGPGVQVDVGDLLGIRLLQVRFDTEHLGQVFLQFPDRRIELPPALNHDAAALENSTDLAKTGRDLDEATSAHRILPGSPEAGYQGYARHAPALLDAPFGVVRADQDNTAVPDFRDAVTRGQDGADADRTADAVNLEHCSCRPFAPPHDGREPDFRLRRPGRCDNQNGSGSPGSSSSLTSTTATLPADRAKSSSRSWLFL